jgi:hypothetical protein
VSIIDVSDHSVKNAHSMTNLDNLSYHTLKHGYYQNRACKLIIEDESQTRIESLEIAKFEEVKLPANLENEQEEEQTVLKPNSEKSLIDRRMLTNPEEFDIYESMIQGESYYIPAFSADQFKK